MNKEADIMTPYPFVIFNRNLNSNTAAKIKVKIGCTPLPNLTKRDTIADYIVILSKVLSNIK